MIAAGAIAILAAACGTAPAYADEIHPWCGAVYEVALLGATQPEDADELAEIIATAEGITQPQKEMALTALAVGVLLKENVSTTATVEDNERMINQGLDNVYKACLKEHA
jgi:hypothetical protein